MSAGQSLCYRDRRTGQLVPESIPGGRYLRWFYRTRSGFLYFSAIMNHALPCQLYGRWQASRWSQGKIAAFVERHHIDLDEVELPLEQYPCFNDFFTRRLKPEARPFAADPELLCAPADGKVLVYPRLDQHAALPVKGALVSAARLLGSAAAAAPYCGGAALVVRLAPYDYHRFHFPDQGRAEPACLLPGQFHSVNPIALERVPQIFARNQRALTFFDAEHFGRIAYVEVGAFLVASIVQTYQPGPVVRGQEKGYFQFGGSTLVLLFEPGRVAFDEDLVRDSAAGLEVQVCTGTRIGRQPV
ncbi:MAG: phosphatidylserine decarboxylase [Candidatus Latescibacteria bacterium]|nr:phosphatidylserine decarboxylase [Candidatus Latescibacterota bacterium]